MSQTPYALLPFLEFHMMESSGMPSFVFFFHLTCSLKCIYLVVCIPFLFLLIAEQYSIIGIYHNFFFVHSHIGEYLGYYQFWAIVDNTTVSIWYKSSGEHTFSFLLDKRLTVKLMDHMFNFVRSCYTNFQVTMTFCIPPAMYKVFITPCHH